MSNAHLNVRIASGHDNALTCVWRRVRSPDGEGALAFFAPVPVVRQAADGERSTRVTGDADEDWTLLAKLRLIAHGSAPGDDQPHAPFSLGHGVSTRVVAVQGRVLPLGERTRVHTGDAVQLGLLALQMVLPSAAPDDPLRLAGDRPDAGADVEIGDGLARTRDTWGTTGDPLLDELHTRYHALLADPAGLGERSPVNLGLSRRALMREAVDPLGELHERADPDRSVHDLLVVPATMDALMASTDALGPQDILADPVMHGVLQLFAPSAVGLPHGPRPGQPLPGLTQREHHLSAADSALPIAGRTELLQQPQEGW